MIAAPVAFDGEGEPILLGAIALEHALLAVDPHRQRLMPVDALAMTGYNEKDLRLSLAEIARRPL